MIESSPSDPATASASWQRHTDGVALGVQSATGYRVPAQTPGVHRGLPSASLTFIFSLDGAIVTADTVPQALAADAFQTEILLAGLHQKPAYIAQPVHEAGVQLAVHPLAARALFGVPARELGSLVVDGVDVLGPKVREVLERLHEQASWTGRFGLLTDYLRRLVGQRPKGYERPRPEIVEAWRWLDCRRGTGSMHDLSRHVSMSPRQLTALFDAEVGLSPKQVARVMRFDFARRLLVARLRDDVPLQLGELAQRCGFYDQSHLIRDFRQFTGLSPTGWVTEERRNIQAPSVESDQEWFYDSIASTDPHSLADPTGA